MTSEQFYVAALERIDSVTAIATAGLGILIALLAIVAVRSLWSR